ncbi:hypothetical protein [Helicobacter bilis]|uniref:Uncharacterized protein n=1 Tax=Helicobacter bilis WiWa TaxID=1235804 RepID=N2B5K8_9HELI|nr:hypothetical protein [Helicobacter bilis]EMZ36942.1 hypothetical protein C826_02264 [Helicobacter bilis WiWa]
MKKIFLILMGLGIFYYTPLSFYLEPSYWQFRNMCKMKYEFYEKGIGNENNIDNYKKQNGYNNIATWHSGSIIPLFTLFCMDLNGMNFI